MSRRTTLSIALVLSAVALVAAFFGISEVIQTIKFIQAHPCLLYTSDAADERSSVDLGGRRIIKKKNRRKI